MGNDVVPFAVNRFPFIQIQGFHKNRSCRIFHGPGHKIPNHYLVVFIPRKRHFQQLGEKSDHLRGVFKYFFCSFLIFFLHNIPERQGSQGVPYYRKFPDHDCCQIGCVGLAHLPMVRSGSVPVGLLASQMSVADGEVFFIHRQLDVVCHAFVGAIDGREPFRIMLCLSLCPYLDWLALDFTGRIDKIKTFVIRNRLTPEAAIYVWHGRIPHSDLEGVLGAIPLGQGYRCYPLVIFEIQRFSLLLFHQPYLMNIKILGV